ncbi:MAG: hypothetical protein JXR34_00225 [Bacteroidales bacterium]|nr:hypothetical protein [Bacteroidales bacterium]
MKKIVTYLQETLSEKLIVQKADKKLLDILPLYIINIYDIWMTKVFDREVLLLSMAKNEHLTPMQYQKHKEQIEKKTNKVVIFVLANMKSYNRNRLIQKKVNFIIEDKQIFIPQLLIDLKEYMPNKITNNGGLQPAAQVILLYHILYQNLSNKTYKDLETLLGYSYLTLSRAIDNLSKLGLCETVGSKTKTVLFKINKRDLWEKALNFFKNPVKKTLYINEPLPEELTRITNINALSFYTDLNGENKNHIAISHAEFIALEQKGLIKQTSSYDGDYHIELWRYNPCKLSRNNVVDPLSLYIIFKDSDDERIEMALKQIMEQIQW